MSVEPEILQFPASAQRKTREPSQSPAGTIPYVEFAVASNFSFLHGASHPEELIGQAAHLGLDGLGLADRNSVAGVVRAHLVKRENDFKLRYHPGARLVFADGTPDILAYPRDRAGWGRLCRLLTQGNLRAEKGECILYRDDLLEWAEGLELVVMPACTRAAAAKFLSKSRASFATGGSQPRASQDKAAQADILFLLREAAPDRVRLAASMLYHGNDRVRLAARAELARRAGVPLIAVNDVLYHHFDRRELQDVLTCIREHATIDTAGRILAVNAERFLKPPAEMTRLFRDAPEAIAETGKLSAALTFSLDDLKYNYPDECVEGFATPQDALVHLAHAGAACRYPDGIPAKVRQDLEHELALIAELKYAPYFLTVYDIVRFARSQEILCQGRGSAANSVICFCLGITEVDPNVHDLLFERFVSADRNEPPDIDVDFEHERREEVIQYIYDRYRRDRTGIAATVICYRGRSAIREVGKVFGLSEDMIGALASSIWGGGDVRRDVLRRAGLDPQSPRVAEIVALANEIQGFPRHLSQHVGGFVITRSRLDEVVPIMNGAMDKRTHVEWDKDDLDALGILKVDVLGLGMLTCIRKAFELVERHYGEKRALATIPPEESAVYRMLCRADSIGVFQVESRAQMSMLPRLKPEKFYDLVIEVAIVRPGPIQGDMVHPYLRRRQKFEEVSYPSPDLEAVLHKTLGVPLFQEQAMKIAIVAGGFTPGEADKLRRAMATFKRTGTIGTFRLKMIEGMVARGYQREFAERCFSQIEGFGEYGFPESHAASFALLVYASAWLKCRYPDAFAAALLNAQPMGFYAPAQIVRDVREHGVEVRPVDVNFSDYDATLEPGPTAAARLHELHCEMRDDIRATHALRLGLREVKGLSAADAKPIVDRRGAGYDSVRDLWLRTGLPVRALERLADADAFGSLGLSRRQALWAVKALGRAGDQDDLPLLRAWPRMKAVPLLPLWGGSTREARRGGGRDEIHRATPTPDPSPQGGGEPQRRILGRTLRSDIPPLKGEDRIAEGDPESGHSKQPPPDRFAVDLPLAGGGISREPEVVLPPMPLGEEVVNDYRFLQLSLRAHPASFLRADLTARGIITNAQLRILASGEYLRVSGLVTIRQRPGSASGVIFMTIEDETAIANIIVWPNVFERFRPIVLGARYICATGKMQQESGVIHVVADRLEDLTPLLGRLMEESPPIETLARADAVKRPHREDRPRSKEPGRIPPLQPSREATSQIAADLDASAHGSAHVPARRAAAKI